jgi:hypothetical protein
MMKLVSSNEGSLGILDSMQRLMLRAAILPCVVVFCSTFKDIE